MRAIALANCFPLLWNNKSIASDPVALRQQRFKRGELAGEWISEKDVM